MANEPHENGIDGDTGEQRKISLAEAMKRKLEQKKQAQSAAKGSQGPGQGSTDVKKMKNQINKKPNNQKRRTGV